MGKRKNGPGIPSDRGGPFDKFVEFTRSVLAVPKAEVDARAAAERERKKGGPPGPEPTTR
jgi:hypothetical protein